MGTKAKHFSLPQHASIPFSFLNWSLNFRQFERIWTFRRALQVTSFNPSRTDQARSGTNNIKRLCFN